MTPDRCFACNRKLVRPEFVFTQDRLSDGRQYEVHVGPECFTKVEAAGASGYQPPTGGPRLYLRCDDAAAGEAARDAYVGKRLRIVWKLTGHPDLEGFTDEQVAASAFTMLGTIRASLERANVALMNSVGLTIADLANPKHDAALAHPAAPGQAQTEEGR